jgi:hypothetical protein
MLWSKDPATPHNRTSEVDDEPHRKSSGFQIGQGNGQVNFVDCFDRLDLDHDLPVNDKIEPIEANLDTLVTHMNWKLPLIGEAAPIELDAKSLLVHLFKKTGAKFFVDGDSGGIDLTGQFAVKVGRMLIHFSTKKK